MFGKFKRLISDILKGKKNNNKQLYGVIGD